MNRTAKQIADVVDLPPRRPACPECKSVATTAGPEEYAECFPCFCYECCAAWCDGPDYELLLRYRAWRDARDKQVSERRSTASDLESWENLCESLSDSA